ncbi:MAG: glycosyltransferase family 9 protein, partial [Methylococcales bacterium]|nr:glycosyltransferase family 9 protein [Methylococcales bacterium]
KRTKFYLAAESEKWAEEFIASHNLKGNTLIGIHPWGGGSWGKTASFKWWPREKFLSLARILSEKYQAKIIVFSEPQLEVPIKDGELNSESFVFPRELTLTQFAALIKKIHLLICNEGGPLQIAVAVGTPSVSIYGPVSEGVYGPYPAAKIHRIVSRGLSCQPCYRRFSFKPCRDQKCLAGLEVDKVLAEVEKALE